MDEVVLVADAVVVVVAEVWMISAVVITLQIVGSNSHAITAVKQGILSEFVGLKKGVRRRTVNHSLVLTIRLCVALLGARNPGILFRPG